MNASERLCQEVRRHSAILAKPGKVLYSAGNTLKPHDIYFLGTKPGGHIPNTVEQSLSELYDGRNEYLDYSWEGRPPGQHKLQKQVIRFLGGIGYDVRDVPATNIVLTRHQSIETHPDLDGDAKLCWPIHLFILNLITPKAVVAFGSGMEKSPFAYLRDYFRPGSVETVHSGQGNFYCHRFRAEISGRPVNVVVVPHLTR